VSRRFVFFLALAVGGFLLYAAVLFSNASFAVGGSDSSGYANTARLLARGKVAQRIEALDRFGLPDSADRVFIPLAFVPGPEPRTMTPFYPAGFPLHIAALSLLLGWNLGPYLASPVAAFACVVLMYFLGRELALPRGLALAGSALLAACAVFVSQALQPMSDVTAALWCVAAILAALRARRRVAWSAAAGAAFGMAVLVRPTSAILFPALLLALPMRPRHLAAFAAGGVPLAAVFFAYNAAAYGHPLRTGWGATGHLEGFALRHFPARFLHYGDWLARMFSPLVPLGWIALPAARGAPLRHRLLLMCWFGAFFLLYCFYEPYDTWWYTRFLLPGIPAMILGALLVARDVLPRLPAEARPRRVIAALLLVTVLAVGVDQTNDLRVVRVDEDQAVHRESCLWAGERLPEKAAVVAIEMSGALLFYTRLVPVRYDRIRPEEFPRLRERVEAAGYRWFALIMPHEAKVAAAAVPGEWTFLGEQGPMSLWRLEPEPRHR